MARNSEEDGTEAQKRADEDVIGLPFRLAAVIKAARRGAASITRNQQVISDAADLAVERFESHHINKHAIEDLEAWASRVGANAAKRLGSALSKSKIRTAKEPHTSAPPPKLDISDSNAAEHCEPDRELLRGRLAEHGFGLEKGRMLDVALKMSEPGMTLHRAARELGMDRSNLRRTFQRALRRLASIRFHRPTDPPPPP